MKLTLNVNGKPVSISTDDPQMPLLYALRDDLEKVLAALQKT
jgi:aerobic-type carbon monoxide dehydrogenase small subunit (CoxS/CutS family)